MGCDGGTIPRRDELVKTKKKPEQKDKDSELSFRWQHCSISQDPLKHPIVACGLGRLYNKDVIIEKLIEKSALPETASHIKNLKDIKNLNLTPNPAFSFSSEKGDAYIDRQLSPYICPLSGLEMNGKFKFCFSWVCGCVFSERSMKQINENVCVKCFKPFLQSDIVILNAVNDDLDLMRTRLANRLIKLKSEKKSKKKTDRKNYVNCDNVMKLEDKDAANEGIVQDARNISLTNSAADTKKDKTEYSIPTKLIGSKRSSSEIDDPAYKKTKLTYSVSKDPHSSNVYKSLFTTHTDAKTHSKAHWVTYNPFYN